VLKREMMVALTDADRVALGNVWRITAKKTDFYLDPYGGAGVMHLSVHGPNEKFDGHRFHLRVDRAAASRARDAGEFVTHAVPRQGYAFEGVAISERAWLVARLRWTWHLQRQRYRAASRSQATFALAAHQSGATSSAPLGPNEAWDVDLVVSYGEPHWPHAPFTLRDDSRLEPMTNGAGMWLTATSYHRRMNQYPAPAGLVPRLPGGDEEPSRFLAAGPGAGRSGEFFWFVESVTAREIWEASG
jgi:hypothetical protein